MRRSSLHMLCRALPVLALAAALAFAGCGKKGDKAPAEEAGFAYPASLGADSTPSDVARVLIGALEKDDEPTLLGLVAAEAQARKLNEIYEKHGRKGPITPPKAAHLTVAGWGASYAFLKPGQTRVRNHEVNGDTARAYASSVNRAGDPQTLQITMVRVDGVWKVLGGLETLPR